jgi:geranylgeranyl reductase family protein
MKDPVITFIANKRVYYRFRRIAVIKIAIVGAGPAGSYCAYKLAEKGIYPSIFDYSHPREKPCGGLIPPEAPKFFPFLNFLPIPHSERDSMIFITPSGRRLVVGFKKGKIRGLSRLKFDQYLLDKAVNEGADLIEEKVIGLEREDGLWRVRTQKQSYTVETIVGADGVNSMVRRNIVRSLSKRDKGVCFGYFVKGLENEDVIIKFLPGRKGYIWIIPRGEDTSVGIGNSEICPRHELKNELDAFIRSFCPHAEKISEWTALIPNVKDSKTFLTHVAGSNWILIGDAAGHVDSITGGGIVYALLDGELASKAIIENNPEVFNKLWIKKYGRQLLWAAKLRGWVYKKPLIELYCIYLRIRNATPFT